MIQEAAKIGLYGFEAIAQFHADPTGITLPIANEELFWGDAGIGMAIMGTTLAVAAIFGSGTPEQLGEWVPQCYGSADDPKVAAFCASEPNAGSDVSSLRTRARYDEANDEWVLNGQKAWATNGGIADVHVIVASVDPELGARGQAAFVVPPGTPVAYDRVLGTRFGVAAIDAATDGAFGTMVALRGTAIERVSLDEALAAPKLLDPELYETAAVFFG